MAALPEEAGRGRLANRRAEGKADEGFVNSAGFEAGAAGRAAPPGSFLQHALQELDLVVEAGVLAEQSLDLAHGVEDGGVVAPAEAPADLRKRAQGQHLG